MIGLGQISEVQTRTVLVQFIRNIKRFEIITTRKSLKESSIAFFEEFTQNRFQLLQGQEQVWEEKYIVN